MLSPSLFRLSNAPGLALGVALCGGALAVSVPAAHAGTFSIDYCKTANGLPITLTDWRRAGDASSQTNLTEGCRANYSPMAVDFPAGSPITGGTSGSWTLSVPNKIDDDAHTLTIVRWKASGTFSLASGAQALISDRGTTLNHNGQLLTGGPNNWAVDTDFPPVSFGDGGKVGYGVYSLETTVRCAQPTNMTCGSEGSNLTTLSNTVTYSDVDPPTGSVGSGSLISSGFGNPIKGIATVDVKGTDVGSGMRHFAAIVDGAVVGQTPDRCTLPYTQMNACPPNDGGTLTVDTTKIPDGTRGLQIIAEDASGERAVIYTGTVVVANNPSIGPGADSNVRGAANGNYGADDAAVTAWWPATGRNPSKSKTVQRRCKKSKSYRRRHATACNGKAPSKDLTAAYSSKKQNIIRGRLSSAAGQPVSGAVIQLLQVPNATGATASVAATATTDPAGNFVARVPAASGSATFAINWLARARDTTPATTAQLRRRVRAASTFSASPKRKIARGRTLTFRGTLRGKAGTPKGTAVSIQASAKTAYRNVKTVRANTKGQWKVRYKVPRQLRGTYRFRAVVTPSGAYPYASAPTHSRPITVR